MRLSKLSLRTRFISAILLVVVLLSASFYFAVAQFIEYLEYELMATQVEQELREFVKAYKNDPRAAHADAEDIWEYVAVAGGGELPAPIRDLGPGLHDDVRIDGREYYVGRQDVDGARLYVGVDMEPVERLEERLLVLTLGCILAGLAIAWLVARVLARLITRPVEALATLVSKVDPTQPHAPLGPQFDDREIGIIAAAFDNYAHRVEEFVQREQAFTEDASHELRTPLTVISGAAQLLADDGQLSEGAQRRVERILRGANQMQRLIEALLQLAREDSGAAGEHCDVVEIVREACHSQQEQLGYKPLALNLHIESPQRVRGSPGMVASLVSNLIANAVHYTEQGRIDVSLTPGCLIVEDSGAGIAPADLTRIFEHRYRGTNSRGLGLGLYLVKRIADRLGWQVQVSSVPGTGTRFNVIFEPLPSES